MQVMVPAALLELVVRGSWGRKPGQISVVNGVLCPGLKHSLEFLGGQQVIPRATSTKGFSPRNPMECSVANKIYCLIGQRMFRIMPHKNTDRHTVDLQKQLATEPVDVNCAWVI